MSDATVNTNIDITATDRTGQIFSKIADDMRKVQAAVANGLTGGLKQAGNEAKNTGDALSQHFGRKAKEALDASSAAAGAFAESLTGVRLGYVAAAAAAGEFTKSAFEDFARVQRGMETIQFSTGATRQQMRALGEQFDSMSKATGESIEQLQGDFNTLLGSSGLGIDQAGRAFRDIGDAATVAGVSVQAMSGAAGAAFSNLRIQSEADRKEIVDAWATQVPSALIGAWTEAAPRLTREMGDLGITGKRAATDLAVVFAQIAGSVGSPRVAVASLTELLQKMGDLSSPIGMSLRQTMQQIHDGAAAPIDAFSKLIAVVRQAGGFSDDLSRQWMAMKYLGMDPAMLRSLKAISDHWDEIQKRVKATGESVEEVARQLGVINKDPMTAINQLSASLKTLEEDFGNLLVTVGADEALKTLASTFQAIADSIMIAKDGMEWISKHTGGGGAGPKLPAGQTAAVAAGRTASGSVPVDRGVLPSDMPWYETPGSPGFAWYAAHHLPGWIHSLRERVEGVQDAPSSVPHMAAGGIVRQRTLIEAGEDGPEAIIPLGSGFGSTATSDSRKQATEDNTSAVNRLSYWLREWTERRSGLAFTPGAGEAATPATAGLLPHWTAGGPGGIYASLGGGSSGDGGSGGGGTSGGGSPGWWRGLPGFGGHPAPGGIRMPGGGIARGPRVRPEGVVPKEHTPETAAEPAGEPGTYRPVYHLSGADLSDDVVNTIAGEAYTNDRKSVDAVVDNMLNRVGSRGWGPSANLREVARAPGQYAGYRRASPAEAAYIRSRIRAIASGQVPDITHGSNSYRASYYHGPWYQHHADAPVIGGNRFAYDPGIHNGPYAPYKTPRATADYNDGRGLHEDWQVTGGGAHWTVDDINKTLDAHKRMRQEMEKPIHTSIAEPKRPALYSQRRRIATREARWRSDALFEQARYASQADLGVV